VKEVLYDCWTCWDGELVDIGKRCHECGRPGTRERDSGSWRRRARDRVSSSGFQEQVVLARQALCIPPKGFTPEEARDLLFNNFLALGISYCWSVPAFQQKLLPCKEEAERLPLFKHLGAFAEQAAKLSFPRSERAYGVEWFLLAKLISSRLASSLGTDNAPDIFLYLVCPMLSPPESWDLKRMTLSNNPALRQLHRFLCALLPIPEQFMTKRSLRDLFLASAKAAYQAKTTSLEEERATFSAMFPEWGAEYPKKHQVRMVRAARRFQWQSWLQSLGAILRQFWQRGSSQDND